MAVYLPLARQVAFGIVTTFSVIVLGLSSHLTHLTNLYLDGYFVFAALAIATAVMSVISLLTMMVVDYMRKGAVTSMIAVELSWLGFLWILWLATGASAADTPFASTGCDYFGSRYSELTTACHEYSAIQAFAFLNWIILMGYTTALLVLSIMAAQKGHSVWVSSVRETNFDTHHTGGKATSNSGFVLNSVAPQHPPQQSPLSV